MIDPRGRTTIDEDAVRVVGAVRRRGLCWLVAAVVIVLGLAAASRARAYVYWTIKSGGIGRANLDGSGVNKSFISANVHAEWLAVDAGHIYWSNVENNSIGRANLDGSGINQNFIPNATPIEPRLTGVAVDAAHIYWGDEQGAGSDLSGAIARANLDGSAINQNFIETFSPTGHYTVSVAVDPAHIYWTFNDGALERANLSGSYESLPRSGGSLPGTGEVAVEGAHVYWSDTSAIERANLDGSGFNPDFISSADAANAGVAVDALGPAPATRGPTKTQLRARALAKCHKIKIKSKHKRTSCVAKAKKRYR